MAWPDRKDAKRHPWQLGPRSPLRGTLCSSVHVIRVVSFSAACNQASAWFFYARAPRQHKTPLLFPSLL